MQYLYIIAIAAALVLIVSIIAVIVVCRKPSNTEAPRGTDGVHDHINEFPTYKRWSNDN